MNKLLSLIISLLFSIALFAGDLPDRPNPPTLVTDYANLLSKGQESALERKLVDYFAETSTQIGLVTVKDLGGYDISDFAFRLGEAWGIGDAKFNNGILIVMKPKSASSRGEVFVAVGYGLEGVVPDATANQIIENEMIPLFKVDDLYGGLDRATSVLMEITKGEYNYKQYAKQAGGRGGFNPFLLILLVFFVFPILTGRRRRSFYSSGGRSSLPFWLAMGMMSGGRRSHSGLFNDFSSGSGSFGGGSSFGSFGGFGGGGFGGGGAGGSW